MVLARALLCLILGACATAIEEPLTYAKFRSPPISLRSGEVANTLNNWGPLEWVKGPIAIRHFDGKIVDDSGKDVSLTEIYVHHWVIFRMDSQRQMVFPNGGLCSNIPNVFGIGAELYHTSYNYPAPHAVVTTGDETWTANMHLIRTTNVPDVQDCIECNCPQSRPPLNPVGGIACCPDQTMCWGMENSTIQDAKNYYLEYTIGYVNVTPSVVPLTVFSLDVTATHTNDCMIEYSIPALAPGEVHVLQSYSDIPNNWSIVYMEAHQHIGGVNFTIAHYRKGKKIATICEVTPVYGTGSNPGNESGYLVNMPTCIFDHPYEVLAGDQLQLTSIYNARTIAGGHAWHEGVMGLVFLAAVAKLSPADQCREMIHVLCGTPPYAFSSDCYQCTAYWAALLAKNGCTPKTIAGECNQTTGGAIIPAPPGVEDMTLMLLRDGNNTVMNVTGPVGSWLGIAVNINSTNMAGADGWVYTVPANGVARVQQRVLGNHDPGQLINPAFPANITTLKGGKVQILFELTGVTTHYAARLTAPTRPHSMGAVFDRDGLHSLNPGVQASTVPYICFLFARGTGTMDLGYHGAARGWYCEVITPPS